jgi:ribosomal protein L37E
MKAKNSKKSGKGNEAEKKAVKCRRCFMVDSYAPTEKKCFHCGAAIFYIDSV